ncbi:MAG: hypothetical protein ABH885_01985 [Candidatus Omnitrophota bacterium]
MVDGIDEDACIGTVVDLFNKLLASLKEVNEADDPEQTAFVEAVVFSAGLKAADVLEGKIIGTFNAGGKTYELTRDAFFKGLIDIGRVYEDMGEDDEDADWDADWDADFTRTYSYASITAISGLFENILMFPQGVLPDGIVRMDAETADNILSEVLWNLEEGDGGNYVIQAVAFEARLMYLMHEGLPSDDDLPEWMKEATASVEFDALFGDEGESGEPADYGDEGTAEDETMDIPISRRGAGARRGAGPEGIPDEAVAKLTEAIFDGADQIDTTPVVTEGEVLSYGDRLKSLACDTDFGIVQDEDLLAGIIAIGAILKYDLAQDMRPELFTRLYDAVEAARSRENRYFIQATACRALYDGMSSDEERDACEDWIRQWIAEIIAAPTESRDVRAIAMIYWVEIHYDKDALNNFAELYQAADDAFVHAEYYSIMATAMYGAEDHEQAGQFFTQLMEIANKAAFDGDYALTARAFSALLRYRCFVERTDDMQKLNEIADELVHMRDNEAAMADKGVEAEVLYALIEYAIYVDSLGGQAAQENEAQNPRKVAEDMSAIVPFDDRFSGAEPADQSAKKIFEYITEFLELICGELNDRLGENAIEMAKTGVIPGGETGYTLGVRVFRDKKDGKTKREVGVYESFLEGVEKHLRSVMDSEDKPMHAGQRAIIDALLEGSVYHEIGHSLRGNADIDLLSLMNNSKAMEEYAELLNMQIIGDNEAKKAESGKMQVKVLELTEAVADMAIGGPGNAEYVRNKAAYLFYKYFAARNPGEYFDNFGNVNNDRIRRVVEWYFDKYPHLARVHAGAGTIQEVAAQVAVNFNTFFGQGTKWYAEKIQPAVDAARAAEKAQTGLHTAVGAGRRPGNGKDAEAAAKAEKARLERERELRKLVAQSANEKAHESAREQARKALMASPGEALPFVSEAMEKANRGSAEQRMLKRTETVLQQALQRRGASARQGDGEEEPGDITRLREQLSGLMLQLLELPGDKASNESVWVITHRVIEAYIRERTSPVTPAWENITMNEIRRAVDTATRDQVIRAHDRITTMLRECGCDITAENVTQRFIDVLVQRIGGTQSALPAMDKRALLKARLDEYRGRFTLCAQEAKQAPGSLNSLMTMAIIMAAELAFINEKDLAANRDLTPREKKDTIRAVVGIAKLAFNNGDIRMAAMLYKAIIINERSIPDIVDMQDVIIKLGRIAERAKSKKDYFTETLARAALVLYWERKIGELECPVDDYVRSAERFVEKNLLLHEARLAKLENGGLIRRTFRLAKKEQQQMVRAIKLITNPGVFHNERMKISDLYEFAHDMFVQGRYQEAVLAYGGVAYGCHDYILNFDESDRAQEGDLRKGMGWIRETAITYLNILANAEHGTVPQALALHFLTEIYRDMADELDEAEDEDGEAGGASARQGGGEEYPPDGADEFMLPEELINAYGSRETILDKIREAGHVVGVPKEIKAQAERVGLTPKGVKFLVDHGVTVIVEKGAGRHHFSDEEYAQAGAAMVDTAAEVWERATIIKKVKEPLESEYRYLRPGQIIFTYLHLASHECKELTWQMVAHEVTGIAYETMEVEKDGRKFTPVLKPMSIIAGDLGAYYAAAYLKESVIQRDEQGREVHLTKPGVRMIDEIRKTYPNHDAHDGYLRGEEAVVLGGGVSGERMARRLLEMGASVTITDIRDERLSQLERMFSQYADRLTLINPGADINNPPPELLEKYKRASILGGCILTPGGEAPCMSEELFGEICSKKSKVIVDIALDQGGNFPGSHSLSLDNPVFIDKYRNKRFCVPNMPDAVGGFASIELEKTNIMYTLALCMGLEEAVKVYPEFYGGMNTYEGAVVHRKVAAAHPEYKKEYLELPEEELLSRIQVLATEDKMGEAAAKAILKDIETTIDTRGKAVMLFASAPSQHATWAHLLRLWEALPERRRAFLSEKIVAFHMDEYLGLEPDAGQLFGKVLKERVFTRLGIKPENTYYFDDRQAKDKVQELMRVIADEGSAETIAALEAEIRDMTKAHIKYLTAKFREHGGVFDIVIGGIGKLPHVAFNDPPEARFEDKELIKLVRLTQDSREQQCIDGEFDNVDEVPTHALTFSLPPILNARHIHIIVPHEFKSESVRRTLDLEITEDNPASGLRLADVLPRVKFYLDEAAASKSIVAEQAKARSLPARRQDFLSAIERVASRIRAMDDLAGQAGRMIPTHPESEQYTLLMPYNFYADNDEFKNQKREFGNRFNLERVMTQDPGEFLEKALALALAKGRESKAIVLIPEENAQKLTEHELGQLAQAGVRFIVTSANVLEKAKAAAAADRNKFQMNTYAMMLLARHINGEMDEESPIYKLLSFYVRTHFELAKGVGVRDFVNAVIHSTVSVLIKGHLSYRPARPFDSREEYDRISRSLVFA